MRVSGSTRNGIEPSPGSQYTSENYRFPYEQSSFDFAYAGSLFTHLTEGGARNYLSQVAQSLKPGGRFVCTWLLFNSQSAEVLQGRSISQIWGDDCGSHRVITGALPEASVIYDEPSVRRWYEELGLKIVEPIRPDATYSTARIPDERIQGRHLYYSHCIIAVKGHR